MTIRELKTELQAAIDYQETALEKLRGPDHPQTLRLLMDTEARLEAFQAVMDRIKGDRIILRLYS